MKPKRGLIALFLIACAAQIAVPVTMMVRAEKTIAHGDVYRFRCAPVDPLDPFRGRYVALGFDVETERIPMDEPLVHDEQALAILTVDADGFARVARLTRSANAEETAIRVRILSPADGTAAIDLPFERYFLNETIAPETERAYRDALSAGHVEAWADVRVRNATATLIGLSIDGVRAEDYVRTVSPR